MDRETSEFYNSHSPQFLVMALKNDEREIPKHADGYGKRTGDCGDTVEIFLTVTDHIITQVNFQADGCIHTNACCNTLVYLSERRSIEEAWKIIPENIVDFLATLPQDHFHCAELVTGALYLALSNYQEQYKTAGK
jgi:nitrogen fixation protein NifU and related proteins